MKNAAKAYNVLIDTWWNVNSIVNILTTAAFTVLIDTWWNVNVITIFGIASNPLF